MWALCGMWKRRIKGSGTGFEKAFKIFGVGTLGM
jgi:hypothetical protein